MRFVIKLVIKFVLFVTMVVVMGGGVRYGQRYIMKASGVPDVEGPKFSSEEADLMSSVFKSALRLFSGTASRDELASELSDKLYAGRANAGEMSELGIELVKPGAATDPSASGAAADHAGASPGTKATQAGTTQTPPGSKSRQSGAKLAATGMTRLGQPGAELLSNHVRTDLFGRVWERMKVCNVELTLVPVVFFAMVAVHRVRRRRSRGADFVPADMTMQPPAECEPFEVKHAVHALNSEEFELLVALIYQRQGYRVSMPDGASGGRGGDFTLIRKAERVLVQCKKLNVEHKVTVERVRELQDAVTAAGATRGMYVASCGFTWDARHFAKTKRMTLINARTLDELISAAREKPEEDLLAVSQWVGKLLSKVEVTPPQCPACEAKMDQIHVSAGAVWVCSQRPECRGRRSARKHQKPVATPARKTEAPVDEVKA